MRRGWEGWVLCSLVLFSPCIWGKRVRASTVPTWWKNKMTWWKWEEVSYYRDLCKYPWGWYPVVQTCGWVTATVRLFTCLAHEHQKGAISTYRCNVFPFLFWFSHPTKESRVTQFLAFLDYKKDIQWSCVLSLSKSPRLPDHSYWFSKLSNW